MHFYTQGLSTREIADTFKDLYDADVSPALLCKITGRVIDTVTKWQSRPLDAIYPLVYLDCIVLKIRQDKRVINKSVYLTLGVNLEDQKELLSMWLSEHEGTKFWLSVLTERKNRGVKDILIACVDALKSFPDAINAVYPNTHIQLCIVRMVRNSMKFVPWKDYKTIAADLKKIYQFATKEEGLLVLDQFAERWDRPPQKNQSILAHSLAALKHTV